MKVVDRFDLKTLFKFFEQDPEQIWYAKDLESRFCQVSMGLLHLYGLSDPSEMLGKTDVDFADEHLAKWYQAEDQEVFCGVSIVNEPWLHHDPSGGQMVVLSSKEPLWGEKGRIAGLLGRLQVSSFPERHKDDRQLQEALEHIHGHFHQKCSIPELARMAHLSVSQFERRFKQVFQRSPSVYVMQLRIRKAKEQLIKGEGSVAEVALDCGFPSQSFFSQTFAKMTGSTPLKFRKTWCRTSRTER